MKKIVVFAMIIASLVSNLSADNVGSTSCDDYRNNKCYYNGNVAADYAYEFGKKSTSPFYDFSNKGGDCTNFASQAILAGMVGITEPTDLKPKRLNYLADQNSRYLRWFYVSYTNHKYGSSWTGADWMYKYVKANKSSYKGLHFAFITEDSPTKALKISAIKRGDIIFADWTGNGTVDHTMIVSGKTCNSGYSCVKVAYHNSTGYNKHRYISLSSINKTNTIFHVYRPTFYSDYGL